MSSKHDDPLNDFSVFQFCHAGVERDVFAKGSGPGVVVMHEIPGITPQVARFSRWIADAGFKVWMPNLFGTPGKPLSPSYMFKELGRACISKEYAVLAAHRASPVTDWLRAISRALHDETNGGPVGAVGMCLTGNFALTLALDPWLMAPVLSQPSLPFPVSKSHAAALHATPHCLSTLKRRAAEDGLRVLGMRFNGDPASPPTRFASLRTEFGDAFEGIEIDSKHANPRGNAVAHSVLTTDLINADGQPTRDAFDRVVSFLNEQLRTGAQVAVSRGR